MPTGYTADLTKEQEVTFKEFLLNCARAFGACITMRDEPNGTPIPEEFKVSDYHKKELVEANAELENFNTLTNEDFERKAQECYEHECKEFTERENRNNFTNDRYNIMLKKVAAWIPPTPEHQGLKDFMKEQIRSSISFDIYPPTQPKQMSAQQYRESTLACILNDIKYHANGYKEEVEKVSQRNKWVKDLRDSIKELA